MIRPMTPSIKLFRRAAFHTLLTLVVLATGASAPLMARAEDITDNDARLEGYSPSVILKDASGTGLTIFLLIVLLGITMGAMFINAKRSHLD